MPSDPSGGAASRWRWPLVVAFLGFGFLALAGYVFYRAQRLPGEILEGGRSIATELRSVAAAFKTGTITTTFVSYATEMSGSQKLQFATLKETEVFERTDRAQVLWGQLELPEVVVRAEAPVEYTYYLDLEERWNFLLEGQRLVTENASGFDFVAKPGYVDGGRIEADRRRLNPNRRALEQEVPSLLYVQVLRVLHRRFGPDPDLGKLE